MSLGQLAGLTYSFHFLYSWVDKGLYRSKLSPMLPCPQYCCYTAQDIVPSGWGSVPGIKNTALFAIHYADNGSDSHYSLGHIICVPVNSHIVEFVFRSVMTFYKYSSDC